MNPSDIRRDSSARDRLDALLRPRHLPRPMLGPALGFCAGIWLADAVPGCSTFPIGITLAVVSVTAGLLVALRRRDNSVLLALLATTAFLGLGHWRYDTATHQAANHIARCIPDEPVLTRIAGRVVTAPTVSSAKLRNPYLAYDPPPKTRFVLSATHVLTTAPPTPVSGLVRISVDGVLSDLRVGDHVTLTGKLWKPRGPQNPGEHDWRRWNYLKRIHAGLAIENPVHVCIGERAPHWWERGLGYLRGAARGLLLDESAATDPSDADRLLDVLLLGQRSSATSALNEAFIRTGTAHYLAVSGFHVGVLAMLTWWTGIAVLRSRKRAAWLVLAVLVLYAALAEHNPPVLRAALMGVLACAAVLLDRPFCAVNWLALSALLLLAWDPLQLFQAGFQLSFVMVFALLTIVPHFVRWHPVSQDWRIDDDRSREADSPRELIWQTTRKWAGGLALVSVVAWLVSLPLVLHHFGRCSTLGFVHSFLVAPLVILLIPTGFVAMVVGLIPPLQPVCVWVTHALADLLLKWVKVLGNLPGGLIEVSPPPAWLVAVTYALVFIPAQFRPARGRSDQPPPASSPWIRRTHITALTIVFALWLGWLIRPTARGPDCQFHVLAVGSGSANVLVAPDGHAAVFDTGTIANTDAGQITAAALRELRVRRLDTVTISHANFDHFSGVHSLVERFPIKQLLTNGYFTAARAHNEAVERLFNLLPQAAQQPQPLAAGDRRQLGDALITTLWPPADLEAAEWRANDRSLVLRVEVFDRVILLTADIERDAIRALLDAHNRGALSLAADVLIAPHHGAVLKDDTAALYEAVDPDVVIVSTARATPKLSALVHDRLRPSCRLYSTRDVGAISIHITPNGALRVYTPFAR